MLYLVEHATFNSIFHETPSRNILNPVLANSQSMHKEMVKLTRATNLTELDPPIFVASVDYEDAEEVFRAVLFSVPRAI